MRTNSTQKAVRKVARAASGIADTTREHLDEYTDKAREFLEEAKHTSVADLEERVNIYVQARPARSLMVAALAGLVLGAYLFRR